MILSQFLKAAASRRIIEGQDDCMLWLADWVVLNTGKDPAEGWRNRYSKKQARAAIAEAGGLLRVASRSMRACEIERIPAASVRAGDVGIVRVDRMHVGAIRAHAGWAVRLRSGIAFGHVHCAAAWRV
jgi:hypothetical protein